MDWAFLTFRGWAETKLLMHLTKGHEHLGNGQEEGLREG